MMTKYEIQNRYFAALAKPDTMDVDKIWEEIDSRIKTELEEALSEVRKIYRPLIEFNSAQMDETRLVLVAYFNENRKLHDFAVDYIKAAAPIGAGEDPNAEA